MNEKRLLQLKKEIEDKKALIEQLKGKKAQLLSDLFTTYKCKGVEAASEKVEELNASLKKLKAQFETSVETLKEYGIED